MSLRFQSRWKRLGALAACGFALAAGRESYVRWTAPLRQEEAKILRDMAELGERITGARRAISEVRHQEMDMGSTRSHLKRLQGDYPDGSPMVWVPTLVKDHFARSGNVAPLVRHNTNHHDPEIPGYERGFWFVGLPIEARQNISTMVLAAVDLELQNPLLRMLDFAIRPDSDNPAQHLMVINIAVLAPKAKGAR
jgi:hypothetical protein